MSTGTPQPDRDHRPRVTASLEIVVRDITSLDVDAIVNAANPSLAGGGGVDGAIHRAAGPELATAAQRFAPCRTGDAVITPGFRLRARHVIHTVGPIWHGGTQGEPELLASCYTRSLELAGEAGLGSVAFPAISTGSYGYPRELAAPIAIETVRDQVVRWPSISRVVFCCFREEDAARYRLVMNP
jgi:O-acetyl-ADP-ribose deacetylase (regulator of RNase III)